MRIPDLFGVEKKVVLITGVSGQLGAQYARFLLQNGAQVAGLDLRESPACKKLQQDFSGQFIFFIGDITRRDSLLKIQAGVSKDWGTPTVLINNAALDSSPSSDCRENGPFEDYPEASWDKVLEVNLKGAYLCCQVFGSAMAKNGAGSIINVASIYGLVSPDQSLYEYRRHLGQEFYKPVAYSASKSGLLNLTRYLAVYWAKHGVRVNTLTIAGVANHQDQAFLQAYCGRIPVGRMAEPDEYNGAVLFLASDASRYMTGANLVVDGGWTAI
jgi:NAD(P)-dependent dehydrogenase (short-subunit alcohol dehydrogenase family)